MLALEIVSKTGGAANASLLMKAIVGPNDTVGAVVDGMPMVAATPYLVTIAEIACYRLAENLLEEGQITVGSRVIIDHLGLSKVGAVLMVETTLRERNKNKFHFDVVVHDGDRLVANVEHIRAAISREKIMSALN